MSAPKLGVAIVTNGRCWPLLEEIKYAWSVQRGIPVSLIVNTDIAVFADDLNRAMSQVEQDYALLAADDVLPVGPWNTSDWNQPRDSIQAVRCLDVEGRGGIEWCRWIGDPNGPDGRWGGAQAWDTPDDDLTYISGHCQVWGPEARARINHSGPHAGIDIRVCRKARAQGIRLLPPTPASPLLIHLERRWPR